MIPPSDATHQFKYGYEQIFYRRDGAEWHQWYPHSHVPRHDEGWVKMSKAPDMAVPLEV